MAKHKVTIRLPERPIGKADAVFYVRRDGRKFGDLTISKGAIVWYRRGTERGRVMSWYKLNELMNRYGRRERSKRK